MSTNVKNRIIVKKNVLTGITIKAVVAFIVFYLIFHYWNEIEVFIRNIF
ncbi:hypothetical protein SAMN05216323_109412 [Williamwhitmania taraxaci]|uniref:Uncharacterized protein n=1 Tax=Williamwhitmania taraxaci TaxID=1640674 RepID=A0A1G6SGW1_9BACT|nr:hypothetical protein SAMN05216323_109412 [Williamwhitmania taraxaci]